MVFPPPALSMDDDGVDREVAGWIEVLLDGNVQSGVVAYDCRAGKVTRLVHEGGMPLHGWPLYIAAANRRGEAVADPESEHRIETRFGHVEARWREGTPPA